MFDNFHYNNHQQPKATTTTNNEPFTQAQGTDAVVD